MNGVQLFILFIASATQSSAQARDDKIHVTVLYASLCPDSHTFMSNQLKLHYPVVKDVINITLVPFGKAFSKHNGANVYCQHGAEECLANRMHSCVLQQIHDQDLQVKFLTCQMESHHRTSIETCATTVGLSSDIDRCMNTEQGTILQLEAERITKTYDPSFIPTIIYDGVFDQDLQDNSLQNFKDVVCYLLWQRDSLKFNRIC